MKNNGVIGVFLAKTESGMRFSVSVRTEQSWNAFEACFKREHKDVDISLQKMFVFECKDERMEIEQVLRKICVRAFGSYKAYDGWESYTVENWQHCLEFFDALICLSQNVISVREMTGDTEKSTV